MQHFLERLEEHLANELPFVAYRKPNKQTIRAILQKDDELHFTNDFKETGFVFSPFDDNQKSVLIPVVFSELLDVTQESTIKYSSEGTNDSTSSSEVKEDYVNFIKKGIQAINEGEFEKVVLSRQEKVGLSKADSISIFKGLLSKYRSAFVYCWYHPKVGLWLGATPETLLKIDGNNFSIMALAGTQNFKGDLNVEWKEKEKEEQQYVTDFIIKNLSPSVNGIRVSETETTRAGNLLHLKTIISARLKPNSSLKKVISDLHPTPAVCGQPKEASKQFILKNETYNREFYTGFLGELNFENTISPRAGKRNIENRAYTIKKTTTQLYVNLRCMQLIGKTAVIYVGGGITKTSDPEKEWEETVSKSIVIKSIL